MAMMPQSRGGGLAFLGTNRAAAAFDNTTKQLQAARKQEQTDAADAATRQALAEAYRPRAATPPAANSQAPLEGSDPAAPAPAPAAPAQPASGNPYGGAISRLTAVPGTGAAAMRLAQQGERMNSARSREAAQHEQRMLVALGKGDTVAAQHWATRAGTTIPPQIAADREQARLFGQGSLMARGMFPNKEQALAFTAAFVRSGGNVNAAQAAAGTPRPAVRAQSAGGGGGGAGSRGGASYSLTTIDTENGPVRAFVNRRNPDEPARPVLAPGQTRPPTAGATPPPAAAPTGRDGEAPAPAPAAAASPYARVPQRAPGQGSAPRPAASEVRRRLLEEGGFSPQDAAAMAGGGMLTPNGLAAARTKIMGQVAGRVDAMGKDAAWVNAETDALMDGSFPGWRTVGQRGQQRPPAPSTAAPPQPPAGGGLSRVQAPPPPTAPQVTTDGQTALTSTPSATAGAQPARPTMTPPRIAPTGPAPAAAPPPAAPAPAATVPGPTVLPPAAMARLREGTVTTFGNGQKWTLQGGQPVQVP
jgi:hypothetical protein